MTNFIPLGYGEYQNVITRVPADAKTLIRDDAAAEAGMPDCWFASTLPPKQAQEEYGLDHGAVFDLRPPH